MEDGIFGEGDTGLGIVTGATDGWLVRLNGTPSAGANEP